MRLAVFSDIHGNLTALEAFMEDLAQVGEVDMIWCLGDLAAFGPRPAECIRRIREWRESFGKEKFHILGGNTDRYLVTGERFPMPPAKEEEAFKNLSEQWQRRDVMLNWNLAQLGWEEYEFLAKILHVETGMMAKDYGPVIAYHGTPGSDESMALRPDSSDEEALDALLDREGVLAIGGHTHRVMDRQLGRWRAVNVGSVGLSFTQKGMVEWGLFTFDAGQLTLDLRSVPYDVEAVIADLAAVDHPVPEWIVRHIRNE